MGENRRIDRQDGIRLTLEEIERLLAIAERTNVEVEPWVVQLAAELRAAMPVPPPSADGAALAGQMRSNPKHSLDAQARLDPRAIKALKS